MPQTNLANLVSFSRFRPDRCAAHAARFATASHGRNVMRDTIGMGGDFDCLEKCVGRTDGCDGLGRG